MPSTQSDRPYSSATLLVVVGAERESLTPDEARLLLHDAADALRKAGGPLLYINAPEVPQP